jgi:hypothetical protein
VTLSDTGASRVNGYLFVLERSLATFLLCDSVRDVVREIDSHLRDRISAAAPVPDERAMFERILGELGPPLRVAQAYSVERTVDEAVVTGKIVAIIRAVWHVAMSTVTGFFGGLGLFTGYLLGLSNGLDIGWRMGGGPSAFRHEHMVGGYWVIPIWLITGFALLFLTHRGARKFLGWWRRRRPSFTVTVRPAT